MCSTVMYWNTGGWHLNTSVSNKPVPLGGGQVFLVTFQSISSVHTCSTLTVVELFVVFTFVKYYKSKDMKTETFFC